MKSSPFLPHQFSLPSPVKTLARTTNCNSVLVRSRLTCCGLSSVHEPVHPLVSSRLFKDKPPRLGEQTVEMVENDPVEVEGAVAAIWYTVTSRH